MRLFFLTVFAVAGVVAQPSSPGKMPLPKEFQTVSADLERARETGDPVWFQRAGDALDRAEKESPGTFELAKARVAVLLGLGRLDAALSKAKELNHKVPDDIPLWGLLSDVQMELGDYAEAEKAAQWMLDLRPGNEPAFVQAARLREIFGDTEGAMEFFQEALRRTPQSETERQAYLLTQYGRMRRFLNDRAGAIAAFQGALQLRPDYTPSLAALGSMMVADGKCQEGVALLHKRAELSQTTLGWYELAEGQERCGNKQAFEGFGARIQRAGEDLAVIFYYADHAGQPEKALEVATRRAKQRRDIYTLDAYAWALYRNGKIAEAKEQMDKALAVGTKDSSIAAHAAKIAGVEGTR